MLIADQPDVMMFSNYDLDTIVTPVNTKRFRQLLEISKYDKKKTQFLINGFDNGFPLGYEGPTKIQKFAPNLTLRVGSPTILWNKIMKEVKEKRYAGPFTEPPFKNFIQSPIGLVPKDGGKETRLIFHLSFPRDGDSVNSGTPTHLCKVKYASFDDAIKLCLEAGPNCSIAKSDMKSAFRHLGMKKKD